MTGIHIVTHAYAVELPQFATFLRYQLSSLVLNPPAVPFLIEVRYSPDDRRTAEVVNEFSVRLGAQIGLSQMQPPERLFRRAIGRNEAALSSHADLVWFCDCDYLFGEGCLDGLWKSWNGMDQFASMVYPETFWTMMSREDGDEVASHETPGIRYVSPDLFVQVKSKKAFGGLQIVPGSLARKHGYLDGSRRYQKPLAKPFANFHDDVAFRKSCLQHGPIVPVEVPNLFRLRHTKTTYQGQVHGTVPA